MSDTLNPSPKSDASFPRSCDSIGKKIEYLSTELLPMGKFDSYVALMGTILHPKVHYIDPVHELQGRNEVVEMLAKYVPRASNDQFRFELILDSAEKAVWKWTISLRIKFSKKDFVINGLVYAEIRDGLIVFQREYYDPMESIEVIPVAGRFYKKILQMA